ncbi:MULTISPECIES: ATP-binding cassette ATPase Uup [unclassified Agarivorans]|uniref:ATP-binding cassette ATPase Uup n=1 Tax=unclassified Agarivorans TaxID=2636026 RepID=UPI0026E21906|nr:MULTISPECIES: ABC transporter ATP-binding protein [unclassified Agarivorans]MDO6688093.1 ABC transporter ATP-binding protein [Agarivorans sp. 3_MG-2023]MDO6717704.1 ABC transporter ATP-binding protein [Agarivorans sp. 2_MG-2023]MDO6766156.1 ABC transporter ATP-binding protein [Agarivorans sp. 1_MG-2023]
MLVNLQDALLAYGDTPLLNKANLQINKAERVCLVGRNGAGKSTLLQVIEGAVLLDSGVRQLVNDVVITRLQQDPPEASEQRIFDYVAEGKPHIGKLLSEFHHLTSNIDENATDQQLNRMQQVQHEIDVVDGWKFDSEIQRVLTTMKLDGDAPLQGLSGGWLRKVALAKALAGEPDILLLDEPTNHLDITTIKWLEEFLLNFKATIVFISHDREFIRKIATRIVDIDRGVLTSWPGNYDTYLEGKAEWLRVEEEQNALFDKRLAEEESWIRQGIKARRTRNEGRVRALKAMRNERSERVNRQGNTKMQIDDGLRSGKIVFEAEGLTFSYPNDDYPIISPIDLLVMRGDKIALVGANGCGKSTLIKILLEQLTASGGSVKVGTKLSVAYFDQYRQELDPDKTLLDNLAGGKQEVEINGGKRHVMGYLQDFLFHPKRAFTPVKALSGGEKNRLMLAKLFLKPANLLVLDEPTNDLDVETLELLEELVSQYPGTVLLVSHDRSFIDNTASHVWHFDGKGNVSTYVGGYSEVERYIESQNKLAPIKPTEKSDVVNRAGKQTKKLSYKLKLELDQLPEKLEAAENLVEKLQLDVNEPEFFNLEQDLVQQTLNSLASAEEALENLYSRWEELEELKNS